MCPGSCQPGPVSALECIRCGKWELSLDKGCFPARIGTPICSECAGEQYIEIGWINKVTTGEFQNVIPRGVTWTWFDAIYGAAHRREAERYIVSSIEASARERSLNNTYEVREAPPPEM